jgi:protein-S-isoprenylcysteine O-methyltransferase Ste14
VYRRLRKALFLLQVPAAAAFYLLLLGQYRSEGRFFGVILEPPTLAFVLLSIGWVAAEALLLVPMVGEPPLFGEFAGTSYDPGRPLLFALFYLPDLLACLDHAHLRWVPLEGPPAWRWVGVALLACALLLTLDADRRMVRHFRAPGSLAARRLIEDGPYGLIRHPRSAGIFLAKLATPVALASGLGLIALVPAVILLPASIRREEEELLRTFGDGFRFYRARTKRLIPWVY